MKNTNRMISPELVKAYLDASYVVHGINGDIILKVGHINHELASLMKESSVTTATFITAFNPFSSIQGIEENELNQSALVMDIRALGLQCIPGIGKDPSNIWASESSVLVLGIKFESVEYLAERYQQNAFIWISSDDGFVSLNLRYPIGTEAHTNLEPHKQKMNFGRLH